MLQMKECSKHQERLWTLLSFLDPFLVGKTPGSILDIGGTEISEYLISQKYPGAEVTVLNTRSKPARNFVLGDAQTMPFDDSHFDMLVCIELIEHVYLPQNVIKEAFRVARSDSLLLLTTPNMNAWHNRLLVPMGFMPTNYTVIPFKRYGTPFATGTDCASAQDHCRVFNHAALVQAICEAGFRVLRTFGLNYSEAGHRFARIRYFLTHMMCKTLQEDIGVVAQRPVSKKRE